MLERAQTALGEAVGRAHAPVFTASYGVTDSTRSDDLRELILAADRALYQAKEGGRDRIVTATPSLTRPEVNAEEMARLTRAEEAAQLLR